MSGQLRNLNAKVDNLIHNLVMVQNCFNNKNLKIFNNILYRKIKHILELRLNLWRISTGGQFRSSPIIRNHVSGIKHFNIIFNILQ